MAAFSIVNSDHSGPGSLRDAARANASTLFVAADFDDVNDAQIVDIETVELTSSGILKLDDQTEALNITGFSGDDIITGGSGADSIGGGSGEDAIYGEQNDIRFDGGSGTLDTLIVTGNFDDAGNAQIVGIERITVGTFNSVVLDLGNQTEDLEILGGGSADEITAGSGNDAIGGSEDDTLLDGGSGTDTLTVTAGFTSASDAQIINVEAVRLGTSAVLNLSNQSEGFDIAGFSASDTITGAQGADSIDAGAGDDTVFGADNDLLLDGGADADTLNLIAGFNDVDDAQIANFEIIIFDVFGGRTLDLSSQSEDLMISGGGSITAGLGGDMIISSLNALTSLDGGAGIDRLFATGDFASTSNAQLVNVEIIEVASSIDLGLQSEDLVFFSASNGGVSIISGRGDDTLTGAGGGDTFDGGLGIDKVRYRASAAGVTVGLASGKGRGGDAAGDKLLNIENITGSLQADELYGDDQANALRGRESADMLVGRAGDDRLEGGDGDDVLAGNRGHDVLSGGLGADTFFLQNSELDRDTITDFESGVDSLTVRAASFGGGLVAGGLAPGTFVTNATGEAEDINDRFIYNTLTGTLSFDSNGSLTGGLQVIARFSGVFPVLQASDIDVI